MSSKNKSSKSYKFQNPGDIRIVILVSEWNEEITETLYMGSKNYLLEQGIKEDDIVKSYVPGAFELPLGARIMLESGKFDAAICLGAVIKGDTDHDKYINQAVASGIMQLGLQSGKPVIFGVLTVNDLDQAKDRAGGKYGNKGEEAAEAALKMISLKKSMKEIKKGIGFS